VKSDILEFINDFNIINIIDIIRRNVKRVHKAGEGDSSQPLQFMGREQGEPVGRLDVDAPPRCQVGGGYPHPTRDVKRWSDSNFTLSSNFVNLGIVFGKLSGSR
jgi:hypothetical protein